MSKIQKLISRRTPFGKHITLERQTHFRFLARKILLVLSS